MPWFSTAKRGDGVTAREAGLSPQAAASPPAPPATVLKKTASELCRARGQCRADAAGAARGARAEHSRPRALPARPSAPAESSQPPTKPTREQSCKRCCRAARGLTVPPALCSLSAFVYVGGHAVPSHPPRCSTQVAAAGLGAEGTVSAALLSPSLPLKVRPRDGSKRSEGRGGR